MMSDELLERVNAELPWLDQNGATIFASLLRALVARVEAAADEIAVLRQTLDLLGAENRENEARVEAAEARARVAEEDADRLADGLAWWYSDGGQDSTDDRWTHDDEALRLHADALALRDLS